MAIIVNRINSNQYSREAQQDRYLMQSSRGNYCVDVKDIAMESSMK